MSVFLYLLLFFDFFENSCISFSAKNFWNELITTNRFSCECDFLFFKLGGLGCDEFPVKSLQSYRSAYYRGHFCHLKETKLKQYKFGTIELTIFFDTVQMTKSEENCRTS